ncbi:MAG: YccT family protein [Marinomonas foliarum]
MKVKHGFSAVVMFVSCFTALPAMAATFEVPRSFEIMYVDLESSRQFGNDFKVNVDEGPHQIVVRFNKILRSGGDSQIFQSEPIVLDLQFQSDTYLSLKAPYISTVRQAEDNVKEPQFSIVDEVSGQEIDYKQQMLTKKSGLQNTRDFVTEVERLTAKNSINANASSAGPDVAPVRMSDDVELQMMQFWYNQSDKVTRKNIRVWIADDLYKPEVSSIQFEMSTFWFNKADKQSQQAFQQWLIKE